MKGHAGPRGSHHSGWCRIGRRRCPLAAVLAGDDERARAAAVVALDRIGPGAKGAVESLTAARKGKNTELRIRAAVVLGKLGADAKSALPALYEAAKDTANVGPVLRPKVPSSVAAAAVDAALKIDPDCTAELAKAALPELTKALESKDTAVLQAPQCTISHSGHANPHCRPWRGRSELPDSRVLVRSASWRPAEASKAVGRGHQGLKAPSTSD